MTDLPPVDIAAVRRWIVARAEYLCDDGVTRPDGSRMRGKLDPVYVETTQGRDVRSVWKHYSSCGDLLHALAWELGVRAAWVNRDDPASGRKWHVGENITMLRTASRVLPVSYLPEPGEFLLLWNTGFDAHVCVAGETAEGLLTTYNYGAGGMTDTEWPGAKIAQVALRAAAPGLDIVNPHTGARKRIQRILDVPSLVLAAGANLVNPPEAP